MTQLFKWCFISIQYCESVFIVLWCDAVRAWYLSQSLLFKGGKPSVISPDILSAWLLQSPPLVCWSAMQCQAFPAHGHPLQSFLAPAHIKQTCTAPRRTQNTKADIMYVTFLLSVCINMIKPIYRVTNLYYFISFIKKPHIWLSL